MIMMMMIMKERIQQLFFNNKNIRHDCIFLFSYVNSKSFPIPDDNETNILILISVCFYVLFYTTLIEPKRQTVIIENINPDLFNELYNEHAESLSCSCSTVSIPYETFVSIHFTFQDVCSSYFIDPKWIEALYAPIASRYGVGSFQTTASFQVNLEFIFYKIDLFLSFHLV